MSAAKGANDPGESARQESGDTNFIAARAKIRWGYRTDAKVFSSTEVSHYPLRTNPSSPLRPMKRATPIPLPIAEIETILFARIAEAMVVAKDSEKFAALPAWTQRVMLILKKQLMPPEFESIISEQITIFHEGLLTALMGIVRDLARHPDQKERRTLRRVMARLATTKKEKKIARQMASGAVLKVPAIQRHIYKRIFAANLTERRAFVEGLALGCRVLEIFQMKYEAGRTDATEVYLMLWLFWPEIDRMKSVGEVGRSLGLIFARDPNLARNWDQRFRKIANRLKLSFRTTQSSR